MQQNRTKKERYEYANAFYCSLDENYPVFSVCVFAYFLKKQSGCDVLSNIYLRFDYYFFLITG